MGYPSSEWNGAKHPMSRDTRNVYDDIEQGEVLWIRPETCHLPEQPDGFALRVDEFLGWDYGDHSPRRVWVRGPALLRVPGPTPRIVTVCVPVDHPRAHTTVAAAGASDMIQHDSRRYRRVF
jgi:hypothetical protein